MSKEEMMNYVIFQLVNTNNNEGLLRNVPHRSYLDLSIIYRFVVKPSNPVVSAYITNDYTRLLGVTEEELFQAAIINTQKIFEPNVLCLSKLFGDNASDMYVITNTECYLGAVNILYSNLLHNLAYDFGSNLFILPSSIHEVIVLPDHGYSVDELREIVHDVNLHEVTLEEQLSDSVYYYERNLKQIIVMYQNH